MERNGIRHINFRYIGCILLRALESSAADEETIVDRTRLWNFCEAFMARRLDPFSHRIDTVLFAQHLFHV